MTRCSFREKTFYIFAVSGLVPYSSDIGLLRPSVTSVTSGEVSFTVTPDLWLLVLSMSLCIFCSAGVLNGPDVPSLVPTLAISHERVMFPHWPFL